MARKTTKRSRDRIRRPGKTARAPVQKRGLEPEPHVETPSAPAARPTTPDTDTHTIDGLTYSLDAPPRRHGRKSVVTVHGAQPDTTPALVDRCDLFSFRARRGLAQLVADRFGRSVDDVLGHLAVVLDASERAQQEIPAPAIVLSPGRRAAAEKLLSRPDLLDRAADDMDRLGFVGEEPIKRLAYLVATSRLVPRPLSALLLAPSGTGKSSILDAILALMPSEHVVSVARLTAQSLFYMGPDALRHRLVVVDEWEGQADADHAIRVLQTRGELTLTTTIKGKAESLTVWGPVAVMSGTVRVDLDTQNTSRCLELPLDDSPDQTRRVQQAQARAWAGDGQHDVDVTLWQDAQRLLDALPVVIPYAQKLRFPARTTADRRASAKLMGLVGAHALLLQHQRDRDGLGRVVATIEDYATVHRLILPLTVQGLDDLSPRAARVYRRLLDRTAGPVTRRQVATDVGVSYNGAKRGLDELLAQEVVAVVEPGPPTTYRLIDRSIIGSGVDLLDPADLARVASRVAKPRRK